MTDTPSPGLITCWIKLKEQLEVTEGFSSLDLASNVVSGYHGCLQLPVQLPTANILFVKSICTTQVPEVYHENVFSSLIYNYY